MLFVKETYSYRSIAFKLASLDLTLVDRMIFNAQALGQTQINSLDTKTSLPKLEK